MRSARIRSALAVLLCFALLCTGGVPLCFAADTQGDEVIVFTQMDEDTGLYLRLDASVRGVSDDLSAAFIPKNEVQTVPQIESGKIRFLLPCAENGDRLELFLPVCWVQNDAKLRITGLLDASGTEVERNILLSRNSYAIDHVWIEYPDPDKTEEIRGYTGDTDTIYCIQGETLRFGMDNGALLQRTEALVDGDALRIDADCTLTTVQTGESTLTLHIAQKMTYTVKVRVFASAQARQQLLLRAAAADAGTIMGRYFHYTVAYAMLLGPFSVLAVPVLYPLAVFVAPIGYITELVKILLGD